MARMRGTWGSRGRPGSGDSPIYAGVVCWWKRRLPSSTVVGCALVASACGATSGAETVLPALDAQAEASPTVGQPTETIASAQGQTDETNSVLFGEFVSISGETIDLAEIEGNDVVLWFWAPW